MTIENTDPLYQITSGDGKGASQPTASPADMRMQLLRLVGASEDRHFVFLFGSPAAGKTVVLGSIVQGMQRPEVRGRLYVHGAGDGYFKHGLVLWEQIRTAFDEQRFPPRSQHGRTIQMHTQYKPPGDGRPMDLIFLEMAGEDLKQVKITGEGGRSLPFHIGQFLKIPKLKIAFLVTTSWQEASRDDAMIEDFLSYVNETAPHLIDNRIILLVTKWDTYPQAGTIAIDEFVRQRMPRTYNKIAAKRNIIQPFSVGNTVPFEGEDGDIIASFDYPASQRLFARIYETFTGISNEREPETPPFWKRWLQS